jgi:hypothetical protein
MKLNLYIGNVILPHPPFEKGGGEKFYAPNFVNLRA